MHVFFLLVLLFVPPVFAANPAGSPTGTTPAEINANFPATIRQNLAGSAGSERFARLTDHEVLKLTQSYTAANNGDPYDLVLSDPVQSARYLKVAAEIAPRPLRPRFGGGARGGGHVARQKVAAPFVPNVGMTLDEIYLVYRTGLGMTVTASLYSTAYFVGINVSTAWGVGWFMGKQVSYLLQNYAPDADNAIGQTLAVLFDPSDPTKLRVWNALLLSGFSSTYANTNPGGGNPGYNQPPATTPSAPPQGAPGVPEPHGTITIAPPLPGFQFNPHGYPDDVCADIAWSSYDGAHC